ncbi:MAG: hypothetical protein COU31_03505 [Candidatus Magasanikbacteria bacterium CG10_big_fil_rev_8_21_14_0_10_40_10]|uniref:PEP-utilising enzyme mobile domain-containing protein n=1 Tax=Candidatus Magasanikbacteria bacterium CG10_big_fil_rev_8_21_14_0_10_40_10 TaxID=1974648 RepID=A0A2M6W3M2_9BACT|nr:MAG: hypothetical protein COU31_03505 [Candidatus Magasanikbacteria bacterium CG10_big_fil_rev_8_21_14_0_10_40_10]
MLDLTNFNWEKYVGRRQPPLRGELALRGVLEWFKDHGFERDFSHLYIYFSRPTADKGIISDHYISLELKNQAVKDFENKIKNNIDYAYRFLDDLANKTKQLDEFSRGLEAKKDFTSQELPDLFSEFCRQWQDFGPNLYIFLLVSEAVENIILQKHIDDQTARTKLLKQVSSQARSEFFEENDLKSFTDSQENFFDPSDPYIQLLVALTEYRDKRKIVYEDSWYKYSDKFFQALERQIGLGDKLGFVSSANIAKILRGGDMGFELEFPSIVYAQNGEIKFEYGAKVKELQDKIQRSTIDFKGELKGNAANAGLARGKVRLVEPHVANQEFLDGEILVTRMTTPDLMPLIRRAAAIVTDEGGITCHAAIVSRELDVPCIIGAKYATQVFQTGDLIEVNANRGIVRKK